MSKEISTFAAEILRIGSHKQVHRGISPAGYHSKNESNMYGIVEIQGQQFKVEEGGKLFVYHMKDVKEGDTVDFDRVMLLDNEGNITVGAPTIEGAKVTCEVVEPLVKGDKVLVFHKKRRKRYRKLNGHRQQYTQLQVKSIVG